MSTILEYKRHNDVNTKLLNEFGITPYQLRIIFYVWERCQMGLFGTNKLITDHLTNFGSHSQRINDLILDLCDKGLLKRIPKPKQAINLRYISYYYSVGSKLKEFELRYTELLHDAFNPPVVNSLPGLD